MKWRLKLIFIAIGHFFKYYFVFEDRGLILVRVVVKICWYEYLCRNTV